MVSRGKADFDRVVSHVLNIFKAKFQYFKLSVGTLEKLLTILQITDNPHANKELLLSYKIPCSALAEAAKVNFCIRCFDGQFEILYHTKKGWGLKCQNCHFRIGVLEKAGSIVREKEQC